MTKTLIFKDDAWSIWRHSGIPPDVMEFLDSVAWGNEGAVYEHKNTAEHVPFFPNPALVTLNDRDDRVQGTAVFVNYPIQAGKASYNSWYVRYFAASKEIRGKGVIKEYAPRVMEAIRVNEERKSVFFAMVEKDNKASRNIVEKAGYRPIAVMKTQGFSRFFPRPYHLIERIDTEKGKAEVLALLRKQYENHSLVHFNALFMHDNYFVVRERGEIVAGCQMHRVHWVVNSMPGLMGRIIMRILPHIPLLNRLFNPRRFEFLAFEGLYFKPGKERKLLRLFEGLLAREKLNSGMYWGGATCPYRKQLLRAAPMGLLHLFVKDSDSSIMASFKGLSEEEIADLRVRPMYVSAFDFT
jgi:RimJ/RimL family protein N-acetyltransferase